MRLLALSSLSAALFSLSLRPWGSGYLALVALAVLANILWRERKPWRGAVAAGIAWLGLGLPALEGTAPRLWWGLPVLLALLVIGWLVAGALAVWLRNRLEQRAALVAFPLLLVATEFVASRRWLFGDSAAGLLALTQADTPLRWLAAWSSTSAVVAGCVLLVGVVVALAGRHWRLGAGLALALTVLLSVPAPGTVVPASAPHVMVAAVQSAQANLDRLIAGFDEAIGRRVLEEYEALARLATDAGAEIVVLGETVLPMRTDVAGLPGHVRSALAVAPVTIVGAEEWGDDSWYNSAFVWNGNGIEAVYRKQALVPYIEADYSAGNSSEPVMLQGALTGLGVCLDSVHAGLARQTVLEGAELLVYMTDDTFAGYTNTPHTHLATAVLRAAETARSAVFANEWGPSALIGPRGAILAHVPLGEAGMALAQLPLARGVTPFVAWGDWLGWLSLAATVGLLSYAAMKRGLRSDVEPVRSDRFRKTVRRHPVDPAPVSRPQNDEGRVREP